MMLKLKLFALMTVCLIVLVPLYAQQTNPHGSLKLSELLCSDCHTCKNPSPNEPCLRDCPRHWIKEDAGFKRSMEQGPDIAVLDILENLYEPVTFSHKLHAKMADMSGGCTICHHHTPTNAYHPSCNECHSPESVNENVKKPGLKVAFHKQCMGCHQEWSHDTGCEKCHLLKSKQAHVTSADSAMSKYFPCQEPDAKVYEINFENGPYVSFFHKNHAHNYGLTCSDCHNDDPCVTCHYQGEKPLSVVEASSDQMHHKCSACHDISKKDGCKLCHSKTERKEFDHGEATGWALKRFHKELKCQSCHQKHTAKTKLSKSCRNCHRGWNSENFDHAYVGLALDEIHVEAECSDCHIENQYDVKPMCTNCHDETPKRLPGRQVK